MKLIKGFEKLLEGHPDVLQYIIGTFSEAELDVEVNSSYDNVQSLLGNLNMRSKLNLDLLMKFYREGMLGFHYLISAAAPELAESEFHDFRFLSEYDSFRRSKSHSLQNIHLYTEPVEAALLKGKGTNFNNIDALTLKTLKMRRLYLVARQVILEDTIGYTLDNANLYDKVMKKAKFNRMKYDNIVFLITNEVLSLIDKDTVSVKKEIIESNINMLNHYYNNIVLNRVSSSNREATADLHRVISLSKAYIFLLPNHVLKLFNSMQVNNYNTLQFLFMKDSANLLRITFKPGLAPRIDGKINDVNVEEFKAKTTPLYPETAALFDGLKD